ncbi:gibberellin 3-beta-dioxygenase 1-like [Nymphaea colorata]|nr:gibberellin 3-beta-dioxygenase 1-like [Nymphaea colorata]
MPSLSQVYKDQPLTLPNPIMDLTRMEKVPDSHAWPPLEDYLDDVPSKDGIIPVISLSEPKLAVMNQVSRACKTWGMFQVVNHGIPMRLFAELESLGHQLFGLPMEQKLKALRAPDSISGYGVARISPFFDKMMWNEGFTVVGSPLEHARRLMPDNYDRFCAVIEEYETEMKHFAERLMELILSSLGLRKDDVEWAKNGFEHTNGVLQMNSYPMCPQPTTAMGLAAHTDSSVMTLLYQTSIAGLQVMKDGHWITVPPIPGAMVINLGDLLHILSNACFTAPLHRALVSQTHHRLSFAYFWGPPADTNVFPHPRLLSLNNPPLYQSITWHDYLKLKAKLFNKALPSLLLPGTA